MELRKRKPGKRLSFADKKTLSAFMETSIDKLKRSGRIRTSEAYRSTLTSFMTFMDGKDILFSNIDADLMEAYEDYLHTHGVSMNSTSFYMRILRAVYNRAVDKKITRHRDPFRHVYTGVEKTVKRAIPSSVIKDIKNMDLQDYPTLDYARDMFLFSFYTRGMSFVDMAYLRKCDLYRGMLSYRRKKTSQKLSIKWEPCMQAIVDKYMRRTSPYLLPIIRNISKEERLQYKNALTLVNRKLNLIGKMLDLAHPLTMYVARHSWASIAKEKNIPVSIISEGMGHESEKTTLIYLAALDSSLVDNANMLILRDFV